MLKVQEIRELIKLIDQSSIDEFTFESDGSKIKMKKKGENKQAEAEKAQQPTAPAAQAEQVVTAAPAVAEEKQVSKEVQPVEEAEEDTLHKIISPMVGTFYQSSSPDAEPYVREGAKVSKDSVVCIVEAMKLFNEIEAEVNGEVVKVLVKDGQLVEYGQPLFLVKPE